MRCRYPASLTPKLQSAPASNDLKQRPRPHGPSTEHDKLPVESLRCEQQRSQPFSGLARAVMGFAQQDDCGRRRQATAEHQFAVVPVERHDPALLTYRDRHDIDIGAAGTPLLDRKQIVALPAQGDNRRQWKILVEQQLYRHVLARSMATKDSSLKISETKASAACTSSRVMCG